MIGQRLAWVAYLCLAAYAFVTRWDSLDQYEQDFSVLFVLPFTVIVSAAFVADLLRSIADRADGREDS